jgi:hypothetical protein
VIAPDPLEDSLVRLDRAEEENAELRAENEALRKSLEPTFPHGPIGYAIQCRCGTSAQRWSQRVGEVFACPTCQAAWTIVNDRGGYRVGD